jgi:hypothetical protein
MTPQNAPPSGPKKKESDKWNLKMKPSFKN